MSWAMGLIFLGSVLVVAVTGAIVIPRRPQGRRRGFPWFWVTFPLAVLGLVSTLGIVLAFTSTIYMPHDDPVGLSMPFHGALGTPGREFLSNEQFRQVFGPLPYAFYLWFFPVLGVFCAVASVIAWRRGRV